MVDSLEMLSHFDEDCLLDVPFTMADVFRAINKLKAKKAPVPDGLMAEHLKAGGEAIVAWLMRVLNAVVELEAIPFEERCHCANIQGWRKGSIES